MCFGGVGLVACMGWLLVKVCFGVTWFTSMFLLDFCLLCGFCLDLGIDVPCCVVGGGLLGTFEFGLGFSLCGFKCSDVVDWWFIVTSWCLFL